MYLLLSIEPAVSRNEPSLAIRLRLFARAYWVFTWASSSLSSTPASHDSSVNAAGGMATASSTPLGPRPADACSPRFLHHRGQMCSEHGGCGTKLPAWCLMPLHSGSLRSAPCRPWTVYKRTMPAVLSCVCSMTSISAAIPRGSLQSVWELCCDMTRDLSDTGVMQSGPS